MAEQSLLESLLHNLLATDNPTEKAAIVAESAFAQLPATGALIAQRCTILRWFDETIVTALLDTLPPLERPAVAQTVVTTLMTLPFVEHLAWGFAYHDQTRTGLLARTPPIVLQHAAALAVPAYTAHANSSLARVEALYCAVVSGQMEVALQMFNTLLEDTSRREDWQAVLTTFHALEEASALPFAASMPYTVLHYFLRGLARHELGDLAGAIADYDQAIALKPNDAVAYNSRGNARRTQGDLAGAIADYDQAIALKPDDAVAYNSRGNARRTQGDLAGAIADYDQAIALKPDDAVAYYNQRQLAMPAATNDKTESYPPQASVREVVRTWVDRLFIVQRADGGILANHSDSSYPPQVWTTAQCLKGILASREGIAEYAGQIKAAFEFIERARRTDQNEGWGYWEESAWTVTEIAAWISLAYTESIKSDLIWDASEVQDIVRRIDRDLKHIAARQHRTGGWSPIKNVSLSFTRTYSTVMALWSFIEAKRTPIVSRSIGTQYDGLLLHGIAWLLNSYHKRLGWVPNPHRLQQNTAFPGLTAQVLFVLTCLGEERNTRPLKAHPMYNQAKIDFLKNQELTQRHISLNDHIITADQHFPPTDFLLEGSTFLWFPWALALYTYLAADMTLSPSERATAANFQSNLLTKLGEVQEYIEVEETYMLAESLFALSYILPHLR